MKRFFIDTFQAFFKMLKQPFANQRIVTTLLMIFFLGLGNIFAAGDGASAISGISTTIRGYIPAVQQLIYAIAAVVALIGAFSIYNKMVNGDQDVKKTIMLTIGGCISLVALSTALPSVFL